MHEKGLMIASKTCALICALLLASQLASCAQSGSASADTIQPEETARPEGWAEDTHGKKATPNYQVVFDQGQVKRLDVELSPEDWQAMLDDMTGLLGEFGGNGDTRGGGIPLGGELPGGGGLPGGGLPQEMIDACDDLNEGDACEAAMMGTTLAGSCTTSDENLACIPSGMTPRPSDSSDTDACDGKSEGDECVKDMMGSEAIGTCVRNGDYLECLVEGMEPAGNLDFTSVDPIYVPCTLKFEGKTWWHVGIRFKGNSSLMTTWSSGSYKLPFKLDMDEFEDEYPEIADQRFYGFKRLAFANNAMDSSYLRDKVAGDVFREGGVAAPRRAFIRVFVDTGTGPMYFGLYTMAEVPDHPMFLTQFGDKGGNLYKPDGQAATWRQGLSVDESSFSKKTNEDEADWSDVENAIAALHASRDDPSAWREGLEKYFEPYRFLNWLAINTVIQDWDTYGSMSHNYYLYGDPKDSGRLYWIPWDHNLSFMTGMGAMAEGRAEGEGRPDWGRGGGGMGMTMGTSLDLDLAGVTDNWPLIRFLMDDPVYAAAYWSYVENFVQGVFSLDSIKARFQKEHDLIAPYVTGPEGEQPSYTALTSADEFDSSLELLFQHVEARHLAVLEALAR